MKEEKVYYELISHIILERKESFVSSRNRAARSIPFILGTSVAILDSRVEVG